MKVLWIKDENGIEWHIEAEAIAKNRASYYAEKYDDTTYDDEFEYTMGDSYDLSDWYFNNMDFADVKASAKRVRVPDNSEPNGCVDYEVREV